MKKSVLFLLLFVFAVLGGIGVYAYVDNGSDFGGIFQKFHDWQKSLKPPTVAEIENNQSGKGLAISSSGMIKISQAEVVSISASGFSAKTWGIPFSVSVNQGTKFISYSSSSWSLSDLMTGNQVDIFGRAGDDNVLVIAEVIKRHGESAVQENTEILRLRSFINSLMKQLQEALRKLGQPLPPGFSPLPSISVTPALLPSISPSPTMIMTPYPSPIVSVDPSTTSMISWHAPGAHDGLNVHEHGDQPPAWADDFSMKNFGHKVIFGGDEATHNENTMKHQAYKGFRMEASGVDLYFRYHAASNPHDRAVPFHSYEVYAKDSSGNVSFWQGNYFAGYPEQRSQRMTRRNEQPGFDALNGINWPGRGQFIIGGSDKTDWENFLRCEQWYTHGGLWSWDISITICGATTFYSVDEHLGDYMNQSTWNPTGSLGATRRLEVSHYGPENKWVGGENLPFDKWFCVKKAPNENRAQGTTPTWSISDAVSGPTACQEGWLPQFVVSTFPKKGVYFETGNTAEKTFPVSNVTLPN